MWPHCVVQYLPQCCAWYSFCWVFCSPHLCRVLSTAGAVHTPHTPSDKTMRPAQPQVSSFSLKVGATRPASVVAGHTQGHTGPYQPAHGAGAQVPAALSAEQERERFLLQQSKYSAPVSHVPVFHRGRRRSGSMRKENKKVCGSCAWWVRCGVCGCSHKN